MYEYVYTINKYTKFDLLQKNFLEFGFVFNLAGLSNFTRDKVEINEICRRVGNDAQEIDIRKVGGIA